MNTRLQVEHPVTEMVTSIDLVKTQIRVAAGEPLLFRQEDIVIRGHAVECRIYAEDPDNNFFPSPGKILERRAPSGPGIRLDDGVYGGWTVPNEYDPMLGKLIAWGNDRAEALARLEGALGEYYASGIKTNVGLFRRILATEDFRSGNFYTRWLDDFLRDEKKHVSAKVDAQAAAVGSVEVASLAEDAAALAVAVWHMSRDAASGASGASGGKSSNGVSAKESQWKIEGRLEQLDREPRR
jgi:acetyl-CoA carboxylase biotin carboxylase subunit